jgi:hypothetical protein
MPFCNLSSQKRFQTSHFLVSITKVGKHAAVVRQDSVERSFSSSPFVIDLTVNICSDLVENQNE